MAGHSKWANIQHRKSRVDAKRGKIFTKLVREITVAAKMGGADPDANPRLRAAIAAAKAASMPNDNIKRAVDKGCGKGADADFEECTYEGYGPAGVAVMLDVVTDNKNRTLPEIRHIFSKCGGNLGEAGSVGWQFNRKGYITLPKEGLSEDRITEIVLEVDAEDFEDAGDCWGVITDADTLHSVAEAMEKQGVNLESSNYTMLPTSEIQVEGKTLEKVMKMIDMFEDNDDVQHVWTNADFDEAELA